MIQDRRHSINASRTPSQEAAEHPRHGGHRLRFGPGDGRSAGLPTLVPLLVCMVLLVGTVAAALDATPVQVGTRGGAIQAHLDVHRATGHLFVVVMNYEDFYWNWLVMMSTDAGATWTETYEWQSTMEIIDIDAVVVDDYLYVAYIDPLDDRYAKVRRFSAIDGAVDTGFSTDGWIEVLDGDPHSIEEVAITSSADSNGVRLYYFAIQSDGALRYSWTNQEGGADTPWNEIATSVTSANHSLEAAYAGDSTTFLYASYEALDGDIHVWRRMTDPSSDVTDLNLDARDWVRISAFEDTVAVLFDVQVGPDRGIDYALSTDAGASWSSSSLTPMDNYTSPAVTLRGGGGISAVYHDVTTPDWAALTRNDLAGGGWTTPLDCSIPGLRTGSFSDVQVVRIGEIGVLFIGTGSSSSNVFFAAPLLLFGDPFETGNTSGWSATSP
jgi:hypothetical protein